jgi:hypothetical protein
MYGNSLLEEPFIKATKTVYFFSYKKKYLVRPKFSAE